MKKETILSICLKLLIPTCVIVGIALCFTSSFMGGESLMLYFTIQSNIWIGALCLGLAIMQIVGVIKKKDIYPDILHTIKLVFTVSITLTGIVFCIMIAPFMVGAWVPANVLTHVVVPILSIVDFILFDTRGTHTYKRALFAAIPPIYYLLFSLIGFFANWNFGEGRNYPYAFINYAGSAGVFGFSTDTTDSLFLGSFYWIIILVGFVIGLGCMYTFICKKIAAHSSKAEKTIAK